MSRSSFIKRFSLGLLTAVLLAVPAFADMGGSGGNQGGSGDPGAGSGMRAGDREMESGTMERLPASRSRMLSTDTMEKGTFKAGRRVSVGVMKDGGVKLELQPHSFEKGVLSVKFFANTHSINLGDYNMMELMHLEFEDVGYRPESMDRMRGHHAGGEIRFRVPQVPDHFRIIVRDLPYMERRVYEW